MRAVWANLVFMAAALAIPPASRGQRATEPVDQKLNAAAQIAKEMAGLPSLGEHDLDEVIRFSMENDRVEPVTRLPVTGPGFATITLKGLPGRTKVAVWSNETIHSAAGKHFLELYYRDLTVPNTIDVYTEVTSNPESVMISQAADLDDTGLWQVTLIQSAEQGPQAVSMYIQTDNGKPSRRYAAGSLAQLVLEYPAQADVFLRPIFRQFRQEQVVFAADSKTAYQVLADFWPADPAIAESVRKVSAAADAAVAGLAADSYTDREAALARLRGLGEPAALYLMKNRGTHLTPEQTTRIELFLAPFRPLPADEADSLKSDADFLLDCLFCPDGDIRRMALNRIQAVFGKKIELSPELSGTKLDEIVTHLREELVRFKPAAPGDEER
jgi:hypothetical protein